MKKTFYFLSLLAATAALNACSSNDEVVASGEDGGIVDGTAYMQVTISMPTGTSTRAAADGGYVDGKNEEFDVKNAKFLFFNSDGSYLTEGKPVTESTDNKNINTADGTSNDNIESSVTTTVVIGLTTIKPNSTIKMLTFLNFKDDDNSSNRARWSNMKGKTLDQILQMTDDASDRYTYTSGTNNKTTYVMTTSAYVDASNNVIQATDVESSHFKTSETEAKNETNPVTAYIERTVAKVGMGFASSNTQTISEAAYNKPFVDGNSNYYFVMPDATDNTKAATYMYNEKGTNLAVKILGWKANAINTKGYLIKHITSGTYKYIDCTSGTPKDLSSTSNQNQTVDWNMNSESSGTYYWNNSSNFRSFWAEDVNYASGSTAKINNNGSVSGDGSNSGDTNKLTYYSFNSVGTNKDAEYVYENTIDQSVAKFRGEDDANVTTMLVVGQIGTWDGTQSSIDNAFKATGDLYRVQGSFYTVESFKTLLLQELNKTYCTLNGSNAETDLKLTDLSLGDPIPVNEENSTSLEKISNVTFSVKAADNVTIYTRKTTSNASNTKVEPPISVSTILGGPISYYSNGYCFYQVPIEHPVYGSPAVSTTTVNPVTTDATIYGVVRNHSYELTLESVGRLGNPVNEPDKEITVIPGKDTYYYLGTQCKVLAWRKATQKVNL